MVVVKDVKSDALPICRPDMVTGPGGRWATGDAPADVDVAVVALDARESWRLVEALPTSVEVV